MVHQTAEALICPYTELATSIGMSRTGDVAGWRSGTHTIRLECRRELLELGAVILPGRSHQIFLGHIVPFSFMLVQSTHPASPSLYESFPPPKKNESRYIYNLFS